MKKVIKFFITDYKFILTEFGKLITLHNRRIDYFAIRDIYFVFHHFCFFGLGIVFHVGKLAIKIDSLGYQIVATHHDGSHVFVKLEGFVLLMKIK